MQVYKYRIYTGPTIVAAAAAGMRAAAMPWQRVTIEGTEHVHVTIDALHADAALRECAQWCDRAGFSWMRFESIGSHAI